MPVLGICRGMQLINVACGGTLLQHVPEHYGHHEHRRVLGSFDGADHDVLLQRRVRGRAARPARSPTRPSPITTRASTASARAWSSAAVSTLDELPEAIELPDTRFALGVQWHPEADPRAA